ncbi:MAG: hypothetical protein GY708_05265 [Actinomycetia bacterium]|nr:hypothetical protein [Actinomycetes bacterium]MCP4957678.1 hypothetical protein [Actinomycetes bacterium]
MKWRRVLVTLALFGLMATGCSTEISTDESTRNDEGEIVEGGDVGVFVLAIGDCFDDATTDEVASVKTLPCSSPHDNQVYAALDLPDGDWPGVETVQLDASLACLDRFEAALGEPYDTSPLDIAPLYPTEGSWGAGDREVLCAVYNVDLSKLTTSLLD